MTELEKHITCEVDEKGDWKFTNPSPWLKEFIAHLASMHGLFKEEVLEKCLLEGVALAYIEDQEKEKVQIVRRELPNHNERPVIVFGKKGS